MLNPFGLHILQQYPISPGAGFNPLASSMRTAPTFYDDAKGLAEALITVEGDPQRHFPESARGLITGAIMWERRLNGANASLRRVRMMLTERERWEQKDNERVLVAGLRRTAELMTDAAQRFPDQGGWQIAILASRCGRIQQRDARDSINPRHPHPVDLSDPLAGDLNATASISWSCSSKTEHCTDPARRTAPRAYLVPPPPPVKNIAWALRGLYLPGGALGVVHHGCHRPARASRPDRGRAGQPRHGIALLPFCRTSISFAILPCSAPKPSQACRAPCSVFRPTI